ncbi:sarcosine oxidase subunit alpha [Herbaspirillum rubrisubalbicans]|jgi:predicted molibdopterin-dependent oxidoreductase YjgC|uniref:Sarcosine oxidase subunit alpha n=2 Tax=Herbaspirillum rubrisubalbicans TaxID=80842 RepID=A0ABX9C018_9BURK|nr:(2Fe-2S)-binding protein [Herbaspirillum rubrisubalbicans]MCP1574964.1 putative molibdopterin-dependent oxidoreductase YjgC [Herbaspirillum rubrisubalbicans]NQE49660.1 sarcosine oxidase subunit alpha [Herbaspirillum rubrisubalbicans]QJQ03484.1 sarcosine oxidase subunit alpha [Herbaspirillum rubrisubalbicans Os34]RAM63683.1 sarcosine oxidase subunit alpha [Herbaspirillum rubrisubalbicans]RAN44856.1 sarcosine oxidase subunit alpha [Herbaspirillum rubrisubalbicans]
MFKTMLRATEDRRPDISIQVDGHTIHAREGETLATALLKAGVTPLRHTPVSGSPRAPFCLMGVCFECLVEVDGRQNVQSCMVQVRAGMEVHLSNGARRVGEPA